MKDLEKIKSEDLGCQVADANPGNFAIEQEVAQLVGATVPAPTEPSADDARELGAQLLVFLRRALTPIQTALRTALAAIYAHLDSRCTDYTPAAYAAYQPLPSYDPMGTPPTPRTLPNLLTAITAFSSRKISNGSAPNDGIPDGVSLAHLLCDSSSVTEICDNTSGWTMQTANSLYTLLTLFPNATKFTIGASAYTVRQWPDTSITRDVEIWAPYITNILDGDYLPFIGGNNSSGITGGKLHLPSVEYINETGTARVMLNVSSIYFEGLKRGAYRIGGHAGYTNTRTAYIYLGCKGAKTDLIRLWNYESNSVTTDIELRDGACQSITLQNCSGLTAENMYNHILCKLKQDLAGCGDGVTITLGSTNIAKLEAVEEYNDKLTELEDTYGYTFA